MNNLFIVDQCDDDPHPDFTAAMLDEHERNFGLRIDFLTVVWFVGSFCGR